MAFTLAQLEALEICLKEAEEKAKSLSEQVIPVIETGKIMFSRTNINLHNMLYKNQEWICKYREQTDGRVPEGRGIRGWARWVNGEWEIEASSYGAKRSWQ